MTKEKGMTNYTGHPVPSPELIQQWWKNAEEEHSDNWDVHAAVSAAAWGADRQLEACIEWLWKYQYDVASVSIRAALRPKPPSLKERALLALEQIDGWGVQSVSHLTIHDDLVIGVDIIRRALEALPDEH